MYGKIYFAGFDVFRKDAIEYGAHLKLIASQYGFEGIWPFDNEIDINENQKIDKIIFDKNMESVRYCDYVVANLNPFRGNEPDSGTVWEAATAKTLGKIVIGYIDDERQMIHRLIGNKKCTYGVYYDSSGYSIENFGNNMNLMLQNGVDYMVIGDAEAAIKKLKEVVS